MLYSGVHQVEQSATELQTFSQLKKQEDTAIPRRQEVNTFMYSINCSHFQSQSHILQKSSFPVLKQVCQLVNCN